MMYFLMSFCVTVLLYMMISTRRKYRNFREITAPIKYIPIFGHTLGAIGKNLFFYVQEITENGRYLPSVLWKGSIPVYITDNPEEIQILLNSPHGLSKTSQYRFMKDAIGEALIVGEVSYWKYNRKIIAKAFYKKILDHHINNFSQNSSKLIEKLKIFENSKHTLQEVFWEYSVELFFQNNVGNCITEDINEITDVLNKCFEIIFLRMSKPYQWWNFVFYNTQTGKSFKNMITYARSIFNEMIYAKKKLKTFVTEGDNVSKYSKPTLDLLLENENDKMTQQHIIDEIVLLLAASSDTIAWTITLTCYMLGMYPDIQENVYNEILRNTDFSEPIDSTTLPKLGYTKMVVKEVLRLFPLGPIVARKTTSDINLGSRVILKGMDFAVSIFNVHRSKKYWKDPLKFDPNRFTPEQVKQRHPYTYIPFSAGPRNCIGWKYAMNVVVYTVAELVRNFNLVSEYVPIENIDFDCLIILKTVENVVVQFQERTM